MKQLINKGGEIVLEDLPAPVCDDNHVLVNNVNSLISAGTETSSLGDDKSGIVGMASMALNNTELITKAINLVRKEGLRNAIDIIKEHTGETIIPLGYSSSGIVLEVGKNVADIAVGDRVACAGAGYANHAEIVSVPKNLVAKIPDNVDFADAAFTTVGTIAMQGVRRAKVEFGDNVVVMGLGLIGLITCQILNAAGARVIGIDVMEERLKLAEKLGVKTCLLSDENVVKEVTKHTESIGADSVIICAATPSRIPANQAMEMARKKGTVVVVGDIGMDIDRSPFYEKELDFLISCSYGPGRYDNLYEEKGLDYPIGYVRWTENRNMKEFLRMLDEGKINVNELVNGVFSIEDAKEAYDSFNSPQRPIGIIFKYNEIDSASLKRKMEIKSISKRDKINVAIVGAGNYSKTQHLPHITNIPNYNLKAVVTRTGINAKNIAEEYGADYYTTDYNEVLEDQEVDMVMISTRHNLHAPQILKAGKFKKQIFVEKPVAMNYEDCENIYNSIKENNVNLIVGFNRRMSLLAQKMKRIIEKRENPLIISYRVNSAGMKKDHWINDPIEGGGAIIGECCHFFDFCNWIVGNEPKSIHATMISSNNESILDNNNIASTIKYEDGSVASIIYTTMGNESFSKERIEIFSEGEVILIDDFKELDVKGINEQNIKLENIDKGQFGLINEYSNLLLGKSYNKDIPTVEDSIKATIISLKVIDSLKTGKIQDWDYLI